MLQDGSFFSIEPEQDLQNLGLRFDPRTGQIHGWLRSTPDLLTKFADLIAKGETQASVAKGGGAGNVRNKFFV